MDNQRKVLSLLRANDSYPHAAARDGILASGDSIVDRASDANAALSWNDYGQKGQIAHDIADAGGTHVIMENGYIGRELGYYLLERGGFNGLGKDLFTGMGPERWERLGIPIEPWRGEGDYVLVVGQRGGGYNPNAMADDWPDRVLPAIRRHTDRAIYYRPHPSRQRAPSRLPHGALIVSVERPLDEQIRRAHVVVGWTSSALIQALVMGVPAIYLGPSFVLSSVASHALSHVSEPDRPSGREQAFWDLAWRQWHVNEIASGEGWTKVAHIHAD